jgi:hypothetical protein
MKSVFYGIETLNKKDMTNEEKLSKALQDFKTKYPSVTSADLQTFIIGWQEAVKNCFIPDVINSGKSTCPDCGDRGWLYDNDGRRIGTCPCHY